MYQAKFHSKDVQIDDYENGCSLEVTSFQFNETYTSDTLKGLLSKIMEALDVENDSFVTYDDEPGRLQVTTLELDDSSKPSESDLALWRKGKLNLYCCDYDARVTKCEPVDLAESYLIVR